MKNLFSLLLSFTLFFASFFSFAQDWNDPNASGSTTYSGGDVEITNGDLVIQETEKGVIYKTDDGSGDWESAIPSNRNIFAITKSGTGGREFAIYSDNQDAKNASIEIGIETIITNTSDYTLMNKSLALESGRLLIQETGKGIEYANSGGDWVTEIDDDSANFFHINRIGTGGAEFAIYSDDLDYRNAILEIGSCDGILLNSAGTSLFANEVAISSGNLLIEETGKKVEYFNTSGGNWLTGINTDINLFSITRSGTGGREFVVYSDDSDFKNARIEIGGSSGTIIDNAGTSTFNNHLNIKTGDLSLEGANKGIKYLDADGAGGTWKTVVYDEDVSYFHVNRLNTGGSELTVYSDDDNYQNARLQIGGSDGTVIDNAGESTFKKALTVESGDFTIEETGKGVAFTNSENGNWKAWINQPDYFHIARLSTGGAELAVYSDGGDHTNAKLQIGGTEGTIIDNAGESTFNNGIAVDGKIRSEEIRVQVINAPDYVFEPDYDLRTLEETKAFITENKHLPEIPSAKEMHANGVDLGAMNMKLLKKIEELTLHQIELLEEMERMKKRLDQLERK